ncbi:MAG: hypothetical protein J5747_01115 [Spirochaetaceae bacterium]|nr:hypothetical protein [Spirochaetaceae bacterium]
MSESEGEAVMEEQYKEQYKKLYEIRTRENLSLTKIVETQEHMIKGLTKEKEELKTALNILNERLEKVLALCDEQQQLLDELIEKAKEEDGSNL